jgi:hypothetical protein
MICIFRKTIVLSILVVFIWGCHSDADRPKVALKNASLKTALKPSTVLENFDAFFKAFNSDSVFQRSRIVFPLKNTSIDDDDTKTTKYITSKKWQYTNFLMIKNVIIHKEITNKENINVDLSIQDTGIQVIYSFSNKQGKWWLISAEDQSD